MDGLSIHGHVCTHVCIFARCLLLSLIAPCFIPFHRHSVLRLTKDSMHSIKIPFGVRHPSTLLLAQLVQSGGSETYYFPSAFK